MASNETEIFIECFSSYHHNDSLNNEKWWNSKHLFIAEVQQLYSVMVVGLDMAEVFDLVYKASILYGALLYHWNSLSNQVQQVVKIEVLIQVPLLTL
jgi:hypothetical protein